MSSTKNEKADRRQKAAELRAAQAKREARRRLFTIIGVVAAVVLIIGGAVVVSLANKKDVVAAPAGSSEYGVAIGDKSAPHQVIVYEDFLCPFCREFEAATRADFAQLASDGKVYVEYRPFDLLSQIGDYPIRAASAFAVVKDASGPEVAKKFHDLLYENQPSEQDPGSVSNDDLVKLAVEAGADEAKVGDDIRNVARKDWVTEATAEAQKAGVTGTPTVLLDGKVYDNGRSIDDIAKNLVADLR